MKNIYLDIKTKGNKFLITVNKDQITPDYILEILNWLQYKGNLLSLGKTQSKLSQKGNSKNQRNWKHAGSVNLNHKIDNVNLRDFAYE